MAGSMGRAGVFAFYPNKQLTTGEGGMVVTDDADLAADCRSLRNQGRDEGDSWLQHTRLGYNYRLGELNCALGLAQFGRFEEILAERSRVAKLYRDRLDGEERLRLQGSEADTETSWFVFVVRLDDRYDSADRDRVLAALRERGIQCSVYFPPIHLQPFVAKRFGFGPGDFPECEALSARTIALPFHHELSAEDVSWICDQLCESL
jgi:perosamine synthetase